MDINTNEIYEPLEYNIYNDKKTYVSDILADKINSWSKGDAIIIEAGMGKGKTHFILNKLRVYARKHYKSLLYICNRRALKSLVLDEVIKLTDEEIDNGLIFKSFEDYNITITTYQAIESGIINENHHYNYDYVVCDEFHYVYSDYWNGTTRFSFKWICDQIVTKNTTAIFMSATAEEVFNDIINIGLVKIENYYRFAPNYDHINSFTIFTDGTDIIAIDNMLKANDELPPEKRHKAVIIVNNKDHIIDLKERWGDRCCCMLRLSNNDPKDKRSVYEAIADNYTRDDDGNLKEVPVILNDSFDKEVLIATKLIDNGINLKDTRIKIFVTRIFDIESSVQAIGRVRGVNGMSIDIYIKNYTNREIRGFKTNILKDYNYIKELADDPIKIQKAINLKKTKVYKYIYIGDDGKPQIDKIMLRKLQYDLDRMEYISKCNAHFNDDSGYALSWCEVAKSFYMNCKPNVLPAESFISTVNSVLQFLEDKYKKQISTLYDKKTLVAELDAIIKSDSMVNAMINKTGNRSNRAKGLKTYNKIFEDLKFPYRLYSEQKRVCYDETGNECQVEIAFTTKRIKRWGIFDIRTMESDNDTD